MDDIFDLLFLAVLEEFPVTLYGEACEAHKKETDRRRKQIRGFLTARQRKQFLRYVDSQGMDAVYREEYLFRTGVRIGLQLAQKTD